MTRVSVFAIYLLTFSLPISAFASVDMISLERTKVIGFERYHEVSVRCDGDENSRAMRKKMRHGSNWCSVEVDGFCNKNKFSLARQICSHDQQSYLALSRVSSDDTNSVKTVKTSEEQAKERQEKKTALIKEQMLIEEQRIQIEQRRLELVRQELSLRKSIVASADTGD